MKPFKKQNVYAFIDSQNLNLGTQKMGWKMDWRKFRQFLTDKYGVTKAYMFIGHVPEYEDLYMQMHDLGFLVVLKPTQDLTKHHKENEPQKTEGTEKNDGSKPAEEKRPIKGNIDADLVLWAMKEMRSYDKAIIVSGDGDFYGLYEYLDEQRKLLHILTPNWQYSQLLNRFEKYIVRIDQLKHELSYYDRNKNRAKK